MSEAGGSFSDAVLLSFDVTAPAALRSQATASLDALRQSEDGWRFWVKYVASGMSQWVGRSQIKLPGGAAMPRAATLKPAAKPSAKPAKRSRAPAKHCATQAGSSEPVVMMRRRSQVQGDNLNTIGHMNGTNKTGGTDLHLRRDLNSVWQHPGGGRKKLSVELVESPSCFRPVLFIVEVFQYRFQSFDYLSLTSHGES